MLYKKNSKNGNNNSNNNHIFYNTNKNNFVHTFRIEKFAKITNLHCYFSIFR